MNIRYRARARADLEEIATYLSARSPAGAASVLRAIRSAVDQIASQPLAWPKTSNATVRVRVLGRYRYKIFYRFIAEDSAVEIVHIRHSSRRPWVT